MALQVVGTRGKTGQFHRGWRLRYAREDAGIGVQEMAARLEVERGTITRWERDEGVRKIVVEAYERHTGFDFNWLWSGKESDPRNIEPVTIRKDDVSGPLMAALVAA